MNLKNKGKHSNRKKINIKEKFANLVTLLHKLRK